MNFAKSLYHRFTIFRIYDFPVDWTIHLTVAAIAEQNGRFLLVEERVNGTAVVNQPAGHVEPGETLIQGCCRETLEEAAWEFAPEALVGIYQYQPPGSSDMYLRFAFCGQLVREFSDRERWMMGSSAPFG